MDLGKLTFGSLVLGFFEFSSGLVIGLLLMLSGLTFTIGFFIVGLRYKKH